jgi:hypothetical protein
MDGDAEMLPHGVRDCRRRAGGRLGVLLLDEGQDFVGALVRAFRSPRAGEQAGQPGRREGRLGRIERLAADPKRGRHLGHRPPLDPTPTEHLVFHLHAIPSVEEVLAREGLVLDRVGARMEGAGGAERDDLRILGERRAPSRHRVMHTTSFSAIRVKGILLDVAATTSHDRASCRRTSGRRHDFGMK